MKKIGYALRKGRVITVYEKVMKNGKTKKVFYDKKKVPKGTKVFKTKQKAKLTLSPKGWKAPRTRKQRRRQMKKCGKKCFLEPDNLGYPVCNSNCNYSRKGLKAAQIRAKQYHNKRIANLATKLLLKL